MYKKFQPFWIFISLFSGMFILVLAIYLNSFLFHGLSSYYILAFLGINLFSLALFGGITIKVTEKNLEIIYGLGLFRLSYPLESIKHVRLAQSPGLLHFTFDINCYGTAMRIFNENIVEIHFANSFSVMHLGVKNGIELKSVLEKRLRELYYS
jgi:hypothetical protein